MKTKIIFKPCGRPHKVYIFLISINSRVRLSVPFLSSQISDTIRTRDTKFGMYVHLYFTLNAYVLDFCHAPSDPSN